jgi:hypothetical protein
MEAEALVRWFFEVVAGFPPEVVAVAVLWTAAKAAGALRPLEDFLKCSKADEERVRKAAFRRLGLLKRLAEAAGTTPVSIRKPPIG